ncbi:MAG TPA: polysaccharide deacetylase family protein [Polyangiaceae bacterium]
MRTAIALGVWIGVACSAPRQPEAVALSRDPEASPSAQAGAAPAQGALRVAITLDDLGATPQSSELALSERILSGLRASGAPVAVFANCQNLRSETLLLWQRAGATVGNHTATHLSLDAQGADDVWWDDVKGCDEQLRSVLGQPVRFFRFPYLRYGKTPDSHAQAGQKLASLGYAIAHVTAATSEWLLAGYYDEALEKRDAALRQELSTAYVDHMLESLQAARDLALKRTGRDVAQITLAHVNQLAADHLPDVLQALRARGWQFISLQAALADPVYALPDVYVGGCGCSWLARFEPPLTRDDTYVFGDYEAQLRERFEKRVKALSERR